MSAPTSNSTFERTAGSHALAAAAQRGRQAAFRLKEELLVMHFRLLYRVPLAANGSLKQKQDICRVLSIISACSVSADTPERGPRGLTRRAPDGATARENWRGLQSFVP